MNKNIWGGIFIWGIFVLSFGLSAIIATGIVADSSTTSVLDQEVIFLLAGGIVTCLIGFIGYIVCNGWLPGSTSNLAPQ
jgi:hypothetical protein